MRLDSIADDIRKGKFSFDEAASYLSQDKDTRNNHGLMANPNSGTARFEMQELAQATITDPSVEVFHQDFLGEFYRYS